MITNPLKTIILTATGTTYIALDPLSMAGITVQAVADSSVRYSIDASLQPLYQMPTYSGSTTGGIVTLPNPVVNNTPVVFPLTTTQLTQTKFVPGSFATLIVTITSSGTLSVFVQQMPAVTR